MILLMLFQSQFQMILQFVWWRSQFNFTIEKKNENRISRSRKITITTLLYAFCDCKQIENTHIAHPLYNVNQAFSMMDFSTEAYNWNVSIKKKQRCVPFRVTIDLLYYFSYRTYTSLTDSLSEYVCIQLLFVYYSYAMILRHGMFIVFCLNDSCIWS